MSDLGFKTIPKHVILSRLPRVMKNPVPVFDQNLKEYGNPYGVYMADGNLGILTSRPEIIRHVLQKNHRNYEKSDIQTKHLAAFLGRGLLTLEGEEWLQQRRLIQPGFHKQKIENLKSLMDQTIHEHLDSMIAFGQGSKVVDMHAEMMNMAFHIVARSLLGTEIDHRDISQIRESVDASQYMLIRLIRLPFLTWYYRLNGRLGKAYRLVDETNARIMEHVKRRRQSEDSHDDLLDMLLHAKYEDTGESMSDQQLLFELLIMFVAGHETSANALSWCLHLLSKHPEELEKIRSLTGEQQTTYIRQVIQEAMRLYPPAWITDRKALEEDEVGGIRIPKGSIVVSYIYGTHHHPDWWSDPEKFDPARFTEEQSKQHLPFSYLPFGGGPRLCIGMQFALMEMELVLKHFLERFDFQSLKQKVEINPLITLNPRGSMPMEIKLRN
ncbi:MAG: cytochrome P450 [Cytophagales bacterium]|nr:cytochrome P450 [Cytophagales bacterium]